ncbi:MAG: threonylcarbamoyl-AMP synthase [Dysgonamonadaceae bacterium]|jgi:tRNA threonylcarbamoyl adenosine modification protein (Sua5/YciO/YrdC/YwlC family)|nr:threonylcarbamoyl-AMP synthase [Dysgonamonadaceae bacterium]
MLIKLYENNPNQREIDKIVQILRNGGIIIYPTDTVYAMGCDALNVRAVEQICKFKDINPQKANLSIICYDLSSISEYAKVSNPVFKLMKKNLPGPFTFILNATNNLPKIYKNRKEVGIRIPDNPIIRTIVNELGNPALSTSVRTKDDILQYATDPELIEEEYGNKVDAVIDGGYGGLEPSTIVDCTGSDIEIVRQGKGDLIYV